MMPSEARDTDVRSYETRTYADLVQDALDAICEVSEKAGKGGEVEMWGASLVLLAALHEMHRRAELADISLETR